jgi:hypothetical protein
MSHLRVTPQWSSGRMDHRAPPPPDRPGCPAYGSPRPTRCRDLGREPAGLQRPAATHGRVRRQPAVRGRDGDEAAAGTAAEDHRTRKGDTAAGRTRDYGVGPCRPQRDPKADPHRNHTDNPAGAHTDVYAAAGAVAAADPAATRI